MLQRFRRILQIFLAWIGVSLFLGVISVRAEYTADTTLGNQPISYPVVDTGQTKCFNATGREITCPTEGNSFFGQDAQFDGHQPSYIDNGDGTVTDNVSGLIWQQSPDSNGDNTIDSDDKFSYAAAQTYCQNLTLAGHTDWQLPAIKSLYSLIIFSGLDPSGYNGTDTSSLIPFIDTAHFEFGYGDTGADERIIDAQFASSTLYVADSNMMFGVNFADGRIKGYGLGPVHNQKTFYVLCVREVYDYGSNDFGDNGDGTISDMATGLMWSQDDSGVGLNWEDALAWVQTKNSENYLGYADWRLPNVKELQSVVDYSRSPDTTSSGAIDPLFNVTTLTNEDGEIDYPFFWSSTTHKNWTNSPGASGAYVAFGRSLGYMNNTWTDVHGAGSQRSDPKSGDPDDWPTGRGPQGDAIRIDNFVRLVRADDQGTTDKTYSIYLPLVLTGSDGAEDSSATENSLFTPLGSTNTYLIDAAGLTIHTWESTYRPGNSVYLQVDGSIIRTGSTGSSFDTGGKGGVVQEIAVDGGVLWEFDYSTSTYRQHHDIEILPSGNILMIAWELKTEVEAIAAGRDPSLLNDDELWPDHIIEVNPDTDEIVWEWHVWDHLVQDYDPSVANYGVVGDHPELVDINFQGSGSPDGGADWLHTNSIDYNAALDQIALSVRGFGEIWIIDHSTTTAEAAGHSGGNRGKGGDLLYRWGNPQAYDAGTSADQQLFVQHDAQWIPDGYPGAGNFLIFNNGTGRSGGNYSSVDEIVPPVDGDGNYSLLAGTAYAPSAPIWSYVAATPTDFYAQNISGAQRLSTGNTLICDGPNGYFFEVSTAGELVWEYDYDPGAVFRVERYVGEFSWLPEN